MAGLSEAFKVPLSWQPQPPMPMPQMGPQQMNPGLLMQHPLFTQGQPPQHTGFFSPGFADFLSQYFDRRDL